MTTVTLAKNLFGFNFFSNLIASIQFYFQARKDFNQLNAMTDKELADIGISRYDIGRITFGKQKIER